MILTLDEVRQTRFHMARRSGYEVTDVDNFVDAVEATLAAMTEENETLKKQVSTGEVSNTKAAATAEPNRELTAENERLRRELESAREQVSRAGQAGGAEQALRSELERSKRENEDLRRQITELQNRPAPAPVAAPMPAAQPQAGGTQKIVVETSEQASPAVVRLVQLSTQQAETVVAEAEAEAKRKVEEANKQAHEITVDARTRAERIESEARVNADKVTGEAQAKADNVSKQADERRTELFAQLEKERDQLRGQVAELRGFESSFRENLTSHLQGQIDSLAKGKFEPDNKPGLLKGGDAGQAPQRESATPRLDALLGDQHR